MKTRHRTPREVAAADVAAAFRGYASYLESTDRARMADLADEICHRLTMFGQILDAPVEQWQEDAEQAWRCLERVTVQALKVDRFTPVSEVADELTTLYPDVGALLEGSN